MIAINSAIEVDLSGQVVADSIGYRMYSGVGGQMDFMRGAALAPGRTADHRAAVHGRARTGRCRGSRRTSQKGAGVVTTRAHVRTVVTEYGVAELWGKSLRERAKALIAIAHPDHRETLLSFQARLHHELVTRAAACHDRPRESRSPRRGRGLEGSGGCRASPPAPTSRAVSGVRSPPVSADRTTLAGPAAPHAGQPGRRPGPARPHAVQTRRQPPPRPPAGLAVRRGRPASASPEVVPCASNAC